ncbi:MAG: hypothetical protein QOE70_3437 [Chthoniobacter sp.]|nr:hypothetical protein [Chthoniobacter sp.]
MQHRAGDESGGSQFSGNTENRMDVRMTRGVPLRVVFTKAMDESGINFSKTLKAIRFEP